MLSLLALAVCAALVFYLGESARLASMRASFRQAGALSISAKRGEAYMVSDRRGGASGLGGGFLPAAVAAEPGGTAPAPSDNDADNSSNSAGGNFDHQLDDLLNSDSPEATFQQVYLLLTNQFVDRIDDDSKLAHGAAASLISALDEPNSRFVEKEERKALEDQSDGLYQGIGAALSVRKVTRESDLLDRQITVIDPLPGSPAEKAGLQTGDVITGINGHWIIGYDPFEAQTKLFKKLANDQYDLGKAVDATESRIVAGYSLAKAQTILDMTTKAPLKLTVERPGDPKPLQLTVDASVPTQVKDIEARKLADGYTYVGINIFSNDTASSFKQALDSVGTGKGLVIDLRDCPGGLLDPAMQIARAIAPLAKFGEIDVRDANGAVNSAGVPARTRDLVDTDGGGLPSIMIQEPICVLVNKGTANTAELLAAFLHDRAGARIAGSATFGDASAQTLFPMSDGSAFTLTTGVLKTDTAIAFNKTGLEPEYALADAGHAGDGDADAGMSKAVALLALGPPPAAGAARTPLQAAKAAPAPPLPGVDIVALAIDHTSGAANYSQPSQTSAAPSAGGPEQ